MELNLELPEDINEAPLEVELTKPRKKKFIQNQKLINRWKILIKPNKLDWKELIKKTRGPRKTN